MGLQEDLWLATHTLCDKCGRLVPSANDMTRVIAATGVPGSEWVPTLWYSRHFLPVVEDGVTVCDGSPSRAQYLPGQPRDSRGYPYIEELEPIYRAAWAALQARERGRSSCSVACTVEPPTCNIADPGLPWRRRA